MWGISEISKLQSKFKFHKNILNQKILFLLHTNECPKVKQCYEGK